MYPHSALPTCQGKEIYRETRHDVTQTTPDLKASAPGSPDGARARRPPNDQALEVQADLTALPSRIFGAGPEWVLRSNL